MQQKLSIRVVKELCSYCLATPAEIGSATKSSNKNAPALIAIRGFCESYAVSEKRLQEKAQTILNILGQLNKRFLTGCKFAELLVDKYGKPWVTTSGATDADRALKYVDALTCMGVILGRVVIINEDQIGDGGDPIIRFAPYLN
jgi:hypothetical protein